jgi:uncharacterized protein (DUF2147 family)
VQRVAIRLAIRKQRRGIYICRKIHAKVSTSFREWMLPYAEWPQVSIGSFSHGLKETIAWCRGFNGHPQDSKDFVMRTLSTVIAVSAFAAGIAVPGLAAAAEPTGEWLVEDKVAIIRIENCGGAMWGINAWEKEPGVDSSNPDVKKRGRPTLGAAIILGMKPTKPNKWEGEIYNPENGKKYEASISLSRPDVLRVTGCVLGFLCGGQDWTRVAAQPPKPGAPKPKTAKEICSSIAELAPAGGSPAQGAAAKPAPKR